MVKIYADGADLQSILELDKNPIVEGFTTNPSLLKKARVTDYKAFALKVLDKIKVKPVSFEVFADNYAEMYRQAHEIASWGNNVYVKIPVTNTLGWSSRELIGKLLSEGIKVNVTAIMTLEQVNYLLPVLNYTPCYLSIFAGRIADSGRDPVPVIQSAVMLVKNKPSVEILWASPRELYNIIQANEAGCHIITVFHDILKKYSNIGCDLTALSLATVQMFYKDGQGYEIA